MIQRIVTQRRKLDLCFLNDFKGTFKKNYNVFIHISFKTFQVTNVCYQSIEILFFLLRQLILIEILGYWLIVIALTDSTKYREMLGLKKTVSNFFCFFCVLPLISLCCYSIFEVLLFVDFFAWTMIISAENVFWWWGGELIDAL